MSSTSNRSPLRGIHRKGGHLQNGAEQHRVRHWRRRRPAERPVVHDRDARQDELNTPGLADGIIEGKVDGVLSYQKKNMISPDTTISTSGRSGSMSLRAATSATSTISRPTSIRWSPPSTTGRSLGGALTEKTCCGSGSSGGQRPSVASYVAVTGATDGVTAAGRP